MGLYKGGKMGIREIAKEANVSIATVSRVLNTPLSVNEDTRTLVLQVAKSQGYKKLNSYIQKHEVDEIGVIMPNITNTFFARVLQGINEEAQKNGYIVNLFLTNDNIKEEQKAIKNFLKKDLKGFIFIRSKNHEERSCAYAKMIQQKEIPLVLVDRDMRQSSFCGIFLSNANAVYEAICLLIENNYKRIALFVGDKDSINSKQRLQGYKNALKDKDVTFEKELIVNGDFSVQSAYEQTLTLIKQNMLPKSIFAFTNELAVGCMKALKEKKLTDVNIFSFNKLDTASSMDINFIEHSATSMGKRSVKILKNKISGTKGIIREILDYKIHFKGQK